VHGDLAGGLRPAWGYERRMVIWEAVLDPYGRLRGARRGLRDGMRGARKSGRRS